MRKAITLVHYQYIFFCLLGFLLTYQRVKGAPRAQQVNVICGHQLEHNSTSYVTNFVATTENIRRQIGTSGFGVAVTGSGVDASYGLAQCYGDLSLRDCVSCYSEALTVKLQCYPFNGGRVFLDGCFMRVENYSFFQEYRGTGDQVLCGNTTRKSSTFGESARQALSNAVASAPNNQGYAPIQVGVPGMNESAYVLADCWRTLNANACRACLEDATASILGCLPWSEGRALYTGCFMRYSDRDFLNPGPGDGSSKGSSRRSIILAVASAIVAMVLIVTTFIFFGRRRIVERRRQRKELGALLTSVNSSKLNFSYESLERATNYFHPSNKLGQGASGSVYKGTLPDGTVVAIKRLFFNTKQWVDHFFNEVNLISDIKHKNLVKLLGCSITGPESLLVYEYVPNQSLHDYFFVRNNVQPLTWEMRYNIILGTAQGLAYLHEESASRIIHRDIKLSNILLDKDFTAKIADFGLARLFPENKTHISTAIAGTLGYMAPEYVVRGKLTEKADVYSFGVLVIEVVSGKRSNNFVQESSSILQMVWDLYGTDKLCEAVDPILDGNYEGEQASRLLQIGLLCVQASAELRPAMSVVVKMLSDKHEIPQPTQPPFLNPTNSTEISQFIRPATSGSQPESYTQSSRNNMTQSWIEPR